MLLGRILQSIKKMYITGAVNNNQWHKYCEGSTPVSFIYRKLKVILTSRTSRRLHEMRWGDSLPFSLDTLRALQCALRFPRWRRKRWRIERLKTKILLKIMTTYWTTMKNRISAIPKVSSTISATKVNRDLSRVTFERGYSVSIKSMAAYSPQMWHADLTSKIANLYISYNWNASNCGINDAQKHLATHCREWRTYTYDFHVHRTSWWYPEAKAIRDRWSRVGDCHRWSSPGRAGKIREAPVRNQQSFRKIRYNSEPILSQKRERIHERVGLIFFYT